MSKVCCFTGNREIPSYQLKYVIDRLNEEIANAIANGYTHFISGMASGTDLIALTIAAEYKKKGKDIHLEAAIPHRSRLQSKNKIFQDALSKCDTVVVLSEEYHKDGYFTRNRYMVDRSSMVIAVSNGKKGGTGYTIHYARCANKQINLISLSQEIYNE